MTRTRNELLNWERNNIQTWLNAFDCAKPARVRIEPSGETISVQNFPLPDLYRPDHIDIALIVAGFPSDPPKGLYLLRRPDNAAIINRLTKHFNVFHEMGFHGAPSITGFEWLCIGHLHGWHYKVSTPNKGDNIQKMLAEFWRLLQE